MSQLDVTEILHDPDFVDDVVVITRTSTVDSLGENVVTETPAQTIGCVQPATGRDFMRLPEEMRIQNISTFWIRGQIAPTGPTKYPPVIVFKGKRYQVEKIYDWSAWGDGYTEGVCIAEAPSG